MRTAGSASSTERSSPGPSVVLSSRIFLPPSTRRHERPLIVEPPTRSPLAFILLVFALTLPFLLIGAVTGFELLPGLPVSALGTVCPVVAAVILVVKESGMVGVGELLGRAFDFRRIESKIWYLPTLLLIPSLMLLAYVLMRVLGLPLPATVVPVLLMLALFFTFFIGALGEELGWSGYATDPLQHRWNALTAAIVNVSWFVFPTFGSHYDPRFIGPITAVAAIIVTLFWGSRTLTREVGQSGALNPVTVTNENP